MGQGREEGYAQEKGDVMSVRTCENCISWSTRTKACVNSKVTEANPRKQSNLSKWLAPICRHYSERVELCGAHWDKPTTCTKPRGHSGDHSARNPDYPCGLTWENPTPPPPIPTAFDKAMGELNYGRPTAGEMVDCRIMWDAGRKDGWQARGKADLEAIEPLKRYFTDGASPPLGLYGYQEDDVEQTIMKLDALEQ